MTLALETPPTRMTDERPILCLNNPHRARVDVYCPDQRGASDANLPVNEGEGEALRTDFSANVNHIPLVNALR